MSKNDNHSPPPTEFGVTGGFDQTETRASSGEDLLNKE